jgi:DNA-binding PadR family transcriptional regulator
MGRIFGRGELPRILLVVIDILGEGHGYTIMQTLEQRVGGGWTPSPGAIYPALLTLEDAGLISAEDRDGARIYRLTAAGRAAAAHELTTTAWASLAARAQATSPPPTLAGLVRDFQARLPEGRVALTADQAAQVQQTLARTANQITDILSQGGSHG